MPLYEYRCLKCDHLMEVLQKHDDPPIRRCEQCSGKVEKQISRTSFLLKGGGWFDQGYGGGSGDSPTSKSKSKSKSGAKTKSESPSKPSKSKSDSGSSSSGGDS